MKILKKTFVVCLAVITALGCMTVGISAADNPDYLYDGIEYYSEVHTYGNTVPNYSVVRLPNESGSFSYSFASLPKQYSDFIIAPVVNGTDIRMRYIATSASHDITVKVIRKDTLDVVYNEVLTALNGYQQEVCIYSEYLETGRGYYIEITSPNIANASGTFYISA